MTDQRPVNLRRNSRPRMAVPDRHVTIVLASCNGAGMIGEQLDSIARQTHDDWSLIVSDDNSSDETRALVRRFGDDHQTHRVTMLRGPGGGAAQNFLSLLRAAGATPYLAFCDQDDVWLPQKLERAVATLAAQEGPAIFGTSTIIADAALTPLRRSMRIRKPTGFGNALVQNVAGGNTMVLNRAALDILQPASLLAQRIVAHDWWCYQMVTACGGEMILDRRPSLYYRQHGGNQIGANDGLRAVARRVRSVSNGQFSTWIDGQLDALDAARAWMTPEAAARLQHFRASRTGGRLARLRGIWKAGLYRQTPRGSLALWIAAVMGRL